MSDISIVWVGHPASWGAGRERAAQYVVMHDTEGHEGPATARAGHDYDVRRTDGTSAHLLVDTAEAVQEVEFANTAYAAFEEANALGVQIEMCHAGAWDLNEPNDAATFTNAAQVAAFVCRQFGWPAVKLGPAELRRAWFNRDTSIRGICGHADATVAYPGPGRDHTDPGVTFPWPEFIRRVAADLGSPDTGEVDTTMRFVFSGFGGTPDGLDGRVHITDGLRYRVLESAAKRDALHTAAGAGTIVTVTPGGLYGWDYGRAVAQLCGTLDPGELAGEGGTSAVTDWDAVAGKIAEAVVNEEHDRLAE